MKKKKILLIDLGVPFGGVETYLLNLAKILHGAADLFAICVNKSLASSLAMEGVRVVPQGGMKNRGKLASLVIASLLMIWARVRYGVSAFWVNGYSEIVLLPIAKLLGAQAIATRHLTMDSRVEDWHSNPGKRISQKLYETLAFTADRIFCVSRRVSQDIVKFADAQKVTVIPNWIPELPHASQPSRAEGKTRLLFVGRLEKYKSASLILEAMRGLEGVSLTIVGDGPYIGELQKMAEGLDVRFAGFQTDPRKFYIETDIFINPSVGPEGSSLVALEAMSFGVPCILSDLDVYREISDDGEFAALFKTGDAFDLRTKITELVTNNRLRSFYAEQARMAVVNRHSSEVARNAYIEQLKNLKRAA